MMGRQDRDQRQLSCEFCLDEMIPTDHLLRRINGFATSVLADLDEQLKAFYSDIGRPSVDPELMIRMLLVGYCYMAFVMSAGCARKSRCTLLTAGSASSI
jgi:transposase